MLYLLFQRHDVAYIDVSLVEQQSNIYLLNIFMQCKPD